jgi:hypothetical protein
VKRRTIKAEPPGTAPPTTIAGTWKMLFGYEGPNNVIASNVLWGRSNAYIATQAQLDTIANIMNLAYTNPDSLLTQLHSTWMLKSVTAYDNAGGNNFSQTLTDTPGLDVTSADAHSPQVAAAISWNTGEKYKGGKPRTYFPGISIAHASPQGGNVWASAFIAALKAAAAAFLGHLITLLGAQLAGAEVGTLHRSKNGAWLTPGPTFVPYKTITGSNPVIGDVQVHQRLDSQRRRLGKEITPH